MNYVIRPVRAEEWALAKELRLAALQDPVAPVAFLETYEQAVAQPDEFWQDRTARGAEAGATRCVSSSPRHPTGAGRGRSPCLSSGRTMICGSVNRPRSTRLMWSGCS